jgi:hypothetical protein
MRDASMRFVSVRTVRFEGYLNFIKQDYCEHSGQTVALSPPCFQRCQHPVEQLSRTTWIRLDGIGISLALFLQ